MYQIYQIQHVNWMQSFWYYVWQQNWKLSLEQIAQELLYYKMVSSMVIEVGKEQVD